VTNLALTKFLTAQIKERLLESVPQYLREIRAVLKNSVGERGSLDAELNEQLSRYKKEYDGYNRENRNSNTHPITWATLQKEETSKEEDKSDILSVMRQFSSDVNIASKVAAHNANFDRKLIFFEAARIKSADPGSTIFDTLKNNSEKFFCTLCVTKNIVRINSTITKSGTGEFKRTVYRFGIKPPALWEVYDSMFGYPPLEEALHDALADVVVCLRVFYRLWMSGIRDADCVKNPPPALCGKGPPDIYGKDVTENGDKPGAITKLINDITPKDETGRPIYPEGNFTKDELRQCFNNAALYQTLPSDIPKESRWGGKRKTARTRRAKTRKSSRSSGRRSKNTNKRRKK
jgi:hypothetical protein